MSLLSIFKQLVDSLPIHYYALSGLVNFFTAGTISLIVFLSNKNSKTNRLFSLFSLAVAYWSLLYFVWLSTKDKNIAEFSLRSCMIGVLFMPSLFFHFVTSFLGLKTKNNLIIFNYILSTIITLTVYSSLYAINIGQHLIFPYWLHTGPVFHIAIIHFGSVVLYSFILMAKAITNAKETFRNQIFYVFVGTAIGYIAGVTNFFSWYRINIPPFLNMFVSVYVVMVAVAVLRYRLMDINRALIRSGILIFVYFFILGTPFLLGNRILGKGGWPGILLFGMFLATIGPFIYTYLSRRTENIIFKEQRRYQQIITDFSKSMIGIRDLDILLKTITLTIAEAVKVNTVAIYLKNDEYKSYILKDCHPQETKSYFQEFIPLDHHSIKVLNEKRKPLLGEEITHQDKTYHNSGLIIPCFSKDGLLSIICLGAKPNKQMYTNDDVLAFENLSYATSLAIENCIFWKEIEDRQRKARLQEMDTYSYSLAHEIDNPMQVILGQANFVKQSIQRLDIPDDSRKELVDSLEYIHECQQRVSGMVKAIRDFGQKTTGELKPLNIEEAIESFARLYHPHFRETSVIFGKISSLKAPVFVRGEKAELMQVLFILADNSVHAMTGLSDKKICLNIELFNQDWLRISLRDNGYGIKKENLSIIFKPFTTTKASTEGTGMGLHNANKIIIKHKGKIWAESEGAGKGATFIIELPVAKDVTQEDLQRPKTKFTRLI